MKARLNPATGFMIYGIVVGFIFVFFVAGLYLGRSFFVQAEKEQVDESPETAGLVRQAEPELDFYRELSKPASDFERDSSFAPPGAAQDLNTDAVREGTGGFREDDREDPPAARPLPDSPVKPAEFVQNSSSRSDLSYTIQVGAHGTYEEARQVLIRLEAAEFSGRIQPPAGPADRYYRVWVGEFSSMEEAALLESKLKNAGFHTYIRQTLP